MAAAGRGGAMVVTSSTNAFFVEQHTAHYSATKGGTLTFVRNAALDLAEYGIRINTICPGIIRTRLGTPLIDDPVAGPEYLKRVPLRRFGEPREIAATVLFLASTTRPTSPARTSWSTAAPPSASAWTSRTDRSRGSSAPRLRRRP